MTHNRKRLTIVVSANTSWNLVHLRSELMRELKNRGHSVIAISPKDDFTEKLMGIVDRHFDVRINQPGLLPWGEIRTLIELRNLYQKCQPDIALNFTIKPVIYGTFVANKDCSVINTITGLGSGFLGSRILKTILEILLRLVSFRSKAMVFQNPTDLELFVGRKLVPAGKAMLVRGSGIDTEWFQFRDLKRQETTVFAYIGRLIRDKGIEEYIEAADRIRAIDRRIMFIVAGTADVKNRSSIAGADLNIWINRGIIEYWGEMRDVRPLLYHACCIVLPSYREGLSRVLQEAGACGRPTIASDVPGCNDIVIHGHNGYLCKSKSTDSLVEKLLLFHALPYKEKAKMGQHARRKIEKSFAVEHVVGDYINEIES